MLNISQFYFLLFKSAMILLINLLINCASSSFIISFLAKALFISFLIFNLSISACSFEITFSNSRFTDFTAKLNEK